MPPLFLRIAIALVGVAAFAFAWHRFGWPGVVVVATVLVMWLLLHFNRMMQVLKRAADRPIGHVDSAVMFNARLKPGVTLLHVTAMTRSLGALQTVKDEQPEVYRWSDNGQSYVDCEFLGGRLVRWDMVRPILADDAPRTDMSMGPAARKIGRFGAAVSDDSQKHASSQTNPGPQRASDNKE